ncbi:hypothetical protein [Nocardioides insulae]|uniref:hypothetical protein n=1 Tax=Nocardioides insulae TaxID=394734 RepID=UPI00040C7507|nr:hypothetical protein [Nocardioides insulae]
MNRSVLTQAARPTAAALPWPPVLAAGAVGLGAVLLIRGLSERPSGLPVLAAAAVVSGALAALRDPADPLLAALPTSRLARRLLRLGLVAVLAIPLLVVLQSLVPTSVDTDLAPAAVALALAGLALATWLPPGRATQLAAALPVVWVTASQLLDGVVDGLDVWSTHPWPVAAVSALAVIAGRHR